MSLHDGHRGRVRERFLKEGLDSFEEHQVLELLLFYSKPRGDVNPLAHQLENRFGTLADVLDATYEELMSVPGVGEGTAAFIKMLPEVFKRYMIAKGPDGRGLNTPRAMWEYIRPRFIGIRDEKICVLCLDSGYNALKYAIFEGGSSTASAVSLKQIVETAITCNAEQVVLFHNHPDGVLTPSHEDENSTKKVIEFLNPLEIKVEDHLIISDSEYYSFRDNGFFS